MTMKGKRTLVFNALMLVFGLIGAEYTPELIEQYVEAIFVLWAGVNTLLRWITSTTIFRSE